MIDSYRHKGLRKKLIETIQSKGIDDERILSIMLKIPRHFYMASGFEERAYQDNAFPIAADQTISQPYTVAFQTMLLNVKKGDKILEIGTGSGYQTSVLLELGAGVYTIERQKELFKSAQKLLSKQGYSPYCFFGDGYEGLPTYAPFDKILITAGALEIPEKLKEQLKTGGIMVAPVGNRKYQKMLTIVKLGDNNFQIDDFGSFMFVPMLKGKN